MKFIIFIINLYIHKISSINLNDYFEDYKYDRKVKTRSSRNLPPCNEDQLMLYLAEIQAINPENIINLSTLQDLHVLCNKVMDSLDKVDHYLKTCEPPHQKDLYIQLIKGVNSLSEKLCAEGPFRKKFEHHYECFHQLHNDLNDCIGPADWTENDSAEKVCKAYHDIADCYYTKAAQLCGKEAADIMKELLLAVFKSILTVQCNDVQYNPPVENVMPEAPPGLSEKGHKAKAVTAHNTSIEFYFTYLIAVLLIFQM